MSKLKPVFITGANAKITIDNVTLAYAIDVNYAIQVDHIAVETMGRYEAVSNEPVNYSVGGSLSVIRYTKKSYDAAQNKLPGLHADGNSAKQIAPSQFNPGNLLASETFDLIVYQKLTKSKNTDNKSVPDPESVMTITDCRFTSRGAGLSKRNLLVEQFNFVGILANDESEAVSTSSDTDLA